jgi:hypothetical protein
VPLHRPDRRGRTGTRIPDPLSIPPPVGNLLCQQGSRQLSYSPASRIEEETSIERRAWGSSVSSTPSPVLVWAGSLGWHWGSAGSTSLCRDRRCDWQLARSWVASCRPPASVSFDVRKAQGCHIGAMTLQPRTGWDGT